MKYLPCFLALLFLAGNAAAEDGFKPLFNGQDLSGWLSAREQATEGAGRFSVNLEEQAIHVYANESTDTEQDIDYLYTEAEYSDYVLKLEYKWLEKRFEPRPTHDRDAGLLFHVHGDLNKVWPTCLEMQLGESDAGKKKDRYATGDLWVIGKDVHVMNARNEDHFYVPSLPLVPVGTTHAYDKSFITEDNEKAHGEWNEITLTVRGGKQATFELNGKVVNQISQMTYLVDDQRVPLDHGRIGLQAEYAELMYRNIRIKELPAEELTTVHSLDELMPYLDDSGVNVRLAPGEYTITAKEAQEGKYTNPPLLVFRRQQYIRFHRCDLECRNQSHAGLWSGRRPPDTSRRATQRIEKPHLGRCRLDQRCAHMAGHQCGDGWCAQSH